MKRFLKIENATKNTLEAILSDQEILDEGKYRLELAKQKWNDYLIDVKRNIIDLSINKSVPKPQYPHLLVIQKMKHMN